MILNDFIEDYKEKDVYIKDDELGYLFLGDKGQFINFMDENPDLKKILEYELYQIIETERFVELKIKEKKEVVNTVVSNIKKSEVFEDNESLMKFKISDSKLKMEIDLNGLAFLLHNSPYNMNGNGELWCKVKEENVEENQIKLARFIIKYLKEPSHYDGNTCNWLLPLESIFEILYESCEDFVDFKDED